MVTEVLQYLLKEKFTLVVDATVGTGGHAEAMLMANENLFLIGIDRDINAVFTAKERLEQKFHGRVNLFCAKFTELEDVMKEAGVSDADAFFFDLGLSYAQLDERSRGFSYTKDGPLDMRMGLSNISAYDVVNKFSEDELCEIFFKYGEERFSTQIAKSIVKARKKHPIARTLELARIIRGSLPPGANSVKSLSRIFQAIRIVVNDELSELEHGLDIAINHLRYGGRLGVIAYHSLEDRVVKKKIRYYSSSCVCPPGIPICACGAKKILQPLTKHPIRPTKDEIAKNKRARTARLRVAEKIKEGKGEN